MMGSDDLREQNVIGDLPAATGTWCLLVYSERLTRLVHVEVREMDRVRSRFGVLISALLACLMLPFVSAPSSLSPEFGASLYGLFWGNSATAIGGPITLALILMSSREYRSQREIRLPVILSVVGALRSVIDELSENVEYQEGERHSGADPQSESVGLHPAKIDLLLGDAEAVLESWRRLERRWQVEMGVSSVRD